MKKQISALLALLMLVPAFASCSDTNSGEETTTDNNASSGVQETEPAETEWVDPFAGTDFDGREFRIYTSTDTTDATNGDAFIRGSGETNGEIVNDAVFDRNAYVSELLDINLTFIESAYAYSAVESSIKKLVMSGADEYDIIANDLYPLANLSRDNYVRNVYNSTILDFDQSYWFSEAMRDLQFIEGGMYLLIGDYFTDSLASCHVLYSNKSMLEDLFGSPEYINDLVFSGKWTLDNMTTICEATALDTNGDGQMTEGDRYGFTCIGTWGSAIPFIVGTDIPFISRTDDGISYSFNTERSVKILEKLNQVFWNAGSSTSISEWSALGLRNVFANGQSLMIGYNRLGDLANLRDIEFSVGVIPYPKLDEEQESYISSMHDTSEIGMIPTTVQESNLDFVYTCLEVLARETGRRVIPAYYEEALKVKYVNGQDDAKMIDLIHDSISTPFPVAYNNMLGDFLLATCFANPLGNKNTDFASAYKKGEKAANKLLERTYASFADCLMSGN